MKDWLKRFFFYLGIASFTFLITRFSELLYNGKEIVFTANILGVHILIILGIAILAAFVIKVPKKEEKKKELK